MHTMHPWKGLRPWRRHSVVLFVAGMVYILVGVAYYNAPANYERERALGFAIAWWPLSVWGIIFIIAGLLSIVSSRWPPISSTWGYTVLTGLSAAWAGFYAAGWIFGEPGRTNINGVLVWGLLAFLWWAVSGLVNPIPKSFLDLEAGDV